MRMLNNGQSTTPRHHVPDVFSARASALRAIRTGGRFVLVLTCLTLLVGWSAPDHPTPGRSAGVEGGIGPVADWIDDMIELLEEVEEELSKSEDEVGAASAGSLSDPARHRIAGSLDIVQARIDQLFSPNHYPSLAPVDAGYVDQNVTPQTLADYADQTTAAAQDALLEAISGLGDDEVIGTRMKTIRSLLAGYRAIAGIE